MTLKVESIVSVTNSTFYVEVYVIYYLTKNRNRYASLYFYLPKTYFDLNLIQNHRRSKTKEKLAIIVVE